jgi:hypothetical protein
MNSFQLRQKGYEHQFVRDQEITFRITARRNKLLGQWAADRLGSAAGERQMHMLEPSSQQTSRRRETTML